MSIRRTPQIVLPIEEALPLTSFPEYKFLYQVDVSVSLHFFIVICCFDVVCCNDFSGFSCSETLK